MFAEWYVDAMRDNEETCHCGNPYDPTMHLDRCAHCEKATCDGTPHCLIAQENDS